jgi:hypothetical protein
MHDEPVATESETAIYLKEIRITTIIFIYFLKNLNVEFINFL